jgi:hypothetical protein
MISYSNITLSTNEFSVVLFLPAGVSAGAANSDARSVPPPYNSIYYVSSRFEHGSMIGNIQTKRGGGHTLYPASSWRMPHNAQWPESGVGLAAEFGVGDDGALCLFRCGWNEATEVVNGVLGYEDCVAGEPFLKIGVGKLIKGSCPACDSSDDYRFNSPYQFAARPVWKLTKLTQDSHDHVSAVSLTHEERLRTYGYRLSKDLVVDGDRLLVKTNLTNLGTLPFSTVWYSHNIFTCDGVAVGPGYDLLLDLQNLETNHLYDEPTTWSWSVPLQSYSRVTSIPQRGVNVEMTRALGPGTRIRAEFRKDQATNGAFALDSCSTSLRSRLIFDKASPYLSMYAYNLYIERETFSPEPQLLIQQLPPGVSVDWTIELRIRPSADDDETPPWATMMQEMIIPSSSTIDAATEFFSATRSTSFQHPILVGVLGVVGVVIILVSRQRRRRYANYELIR